ncbi:mediator of RNA polymerase II transcription subunit 13 [Vermiconidia calcicola]|uniref:Mediator of RNA polymerase II transcription subunit 13 n=1 Tax=Vermiconidia calcicola TaxID=1690605 RepID=A0ACC3MPY1_9PEZI|nr:mediator of RNA polymerase II transcription subunit 13 [Vermiconidia calcicola]
MNGLDFLKSCTTNVRMVENILQMQYAIYVRDRSEITDSSVQLAIAKLRQHNILCAAANEQLWVFGPLELEFEQFLGSAGYSFNQYGRAKVTPEPTSLAPNGRSVKDVLLKAIEGCITYSLAKGDGVLHVGFFAWLFTEPALGESQTENAKLLVTLHVHFTETGALYVSCTTHRSDLRPIRIAEMNPSKTVVLVPSGSKVKLLSTSDSGNIEHTGRAGKTICSPIWKSYVEEAMVSEGVALNDHDEWTLVELVDGKVHERFSWPTRLCVAVESISRSRSHLSKDLQPWQQWFGSFDGTHVHFRDPLAAAEEWFTSAAERKKAVVGGTEHVTSAIDDAHDGMAIVSETPLATSPPFNQLVADQQAAVAGIYPTPPDGAIPSQAAQQPTSDGLTSAMQVDQDDADNELELPDSDDNHPRNDSVASADPQAYHHNSDDLFGDMEGIEFEANEVGDADFDYFDEPDDLPQVRMSHPDIDMTGSEAVEEHDDMDTRPQDELDDDDGYDLRAAEDQAPLASSRPTSSHDQPLEAMRENSDHDDIAQAIHPPNSVSVSPTEPRKSEKPLSPFGIRERLLPPPIPASALAPHDAPSDSVRRGSRFEPVTFNESLDLSTKYAAVFSNESSVRLQNAPDISLPSKQKDARPKPANDPDSGVTDMDTSSDEDSCDLTSSSSEDEDLPPKVPWDTRKRKRTMYPDQLTPAGGDGELTWADDTMELDVGKSKMQSVLNALVNQTIGLTKVLPHIAYNAVHSRRSVSIDMAAVDPVEDLLGLSKLDLVYVAQIVCEQAISSIPGIVASLDCEDIAAENDSVPAESAIRSLVEAGMQNTIPNVEECDLAKLALIREPPPRPTANPGKAPQASHQRLTHRDGNTQLGPDYFAIPPPYLRVQRGSDSWEMLPPAVHFWNALGLGPASGAKDVRVIGMVPGNEDLAAYVHSFLRDLGSAYESCKLGSFSMQSSFDEQLDELEDFENGVMMIAADEESFALTDAIKSYSAACTELGEALAKVGHLEPDRTIVICLVDPFEDERATHHLGACFWQLCKSYRQNVPKAHQKSARSDLALQILPVSLVASRDSLVLLDAAQMNTLAIEVYGRCPPSVKAAASTDVTSALPILAAQAVELASTPPKKIGFQLTSDPPTDLMHEGSVLHLAYALSSDGKWMTAYWIDSTGRYQMTSAACLQGKSFHDAAVEVWEKTSEMLNAREVTWRVFIVSNVKMNEGLQKCWKAIVTSKFRKQVLHVALLSIETDPMIQLLPPHLPDSAQQASNPHGQGNGFLTPVTTPQGSNVTVSPDASGISSNAPLTPVSSDNTANIAEADPDAHLVDLTDESWGVVLSPAVTSESSHGDSLSNSVDGFSSRLAQGLLCKRGDLHLPSSDGRLRTLGVTVHWDIRTRQGSNVDEGPARQAEATLREVLRMYRSLGLLAKLRNLSAAGGKDGNARHTCGIAPIHVLSAVTGAEALNGLLP